jgi:hypothetical protein
MGDDLTAAMFTGRELCGAGPARFVRDAQPDVVAGRGGEAADPPLVHA